MKNVQESQALQEQRNTTIETNQGKMMEQLNRMEKELQRLAFDIDMNRPDITDFFPIKDNGSIREFLSNEDGNFKERRKQFEFLLYDVSSKQKTHQKQFGEALKKLLFTRDYVSSHRWPNAR